VSTKDGKPKAKREQPDIVRREMSFVVQGLDIDVMVERARRRAAHFFNEPLKNIQIQAGAPTVAEYDPFPTDLENPPEPALWQIHVQAVVKDKDEEQIEPPAPNR
jgi:gluconate kinase